jgi:zinc transport system ATP-binding protein
VTSPAVELSDVDVRLGGRLVLESVDFRVDRGEFLAIIGPNGGGKTTLFRLLLGLVRAERGKVRVLGGDPEAARGRVGYVPQFVHFDRDFPIRVLDVVRMGRLGNRRSLLPFRSGDTRAAREVLGQLKIADLEDRQVGRLSGGQLQRVLIARALVLSPEILLLDEPTASLDIFSAEGFYELLRELATKMTVILVSHDVGTVSAHVQSIACLNRRVFSHAHELSTDDLLRAYGCPIELIGHGEMPHRVLGRHQEHAE